ncbi:MAG: AMP-binding protein [Myxococcota bacterium]
MTDSTAFDYAAHGLAAPERRPTIPGAPATLAAVLDRMVTEDPDAEALVGRSGRFSYVDLDLAVDRAARGLASLGVEAGVRVAACLPNDVQIVIAFLAAMRLGAIWVGVNRALAVPEKLYLLRDCGASVLLALPDTATQIDAQSHTQNPKLESLRKIVNVEPGNSACEWETIQSDADAVRCPDIEIDPHGPAAIAYTSGTTGHPKGAVHSQHNLLLPGAVSAATGRYAPDLRQGCVLPLTILNLMVLSPLVAFQIGSCCVAMDRIDPEGLAEWVRTERVGTFAGVPTILHDLLTHPNVKPDDLESLVSPLVGGAECPEEFRDLYRERFGREVGIGYGMTEAPTAVTSAAGASSPDTSPRPGLCGVALPQVAIEIRDEDNRVLGPEEVGEICVAPAPAGDWAGIYTPMLGYWDRSDASAEALCGGVYHSGDLGLMDVDGTLFIRGRRNELILRGGANVYPAEVERVIGEDPRVAAVAVLGIAHPRLGERVVAAVEPEPGGSPAPEELEARCRSQLAAYKVPDQIVLVETLPRNAMAKVIKRELEPLFAKQRGEEPIR